MRERAGQRRRRLGRGLAIGLLVWAFGVGAETETETDAETESGVGAEPPGPGLPCGPFDGRDAPLAPTRPAAPLQEPGITSPGSSETATSADAGEILRLPLPGPRATGPGPESERPSEALLALPKDASGALPMDFELAPGARIVRSFFSPVLCATVARVVGPAGVSPRDLVPRLPDSALAVANDLYASAVEESGPEGPPICARDGAGIPMARCSTGSRRRASGEPVG